MKKISKLVASVLLALAASSAFAVDYGFLLDNNTAFKTDLKKNFYLKQKDTVTAWVKVPFGQNYNNYFIGEGLYRFEYNEDSKQLKNYADLNLLKVVLFNKFAKGSLTTNIGRFNVIDASGLVFTQNADGAFVKYANRVVEVSAYAGYTGLLNGNLIVMIDAPAFKGCDEKKVYDFADKNIVGMVTGSFPYLFADQTLTVQALGAFRLDKIAYNRIYATLGLNGPIAGNLFYNLTGTFEFSSYNGANMKFSPLVKADISYYFPIASVGLKAVFAGKDFTGITSQTALDSISEPEYTNLLKVGLNGSVKPVDCLVINASADVAFDGNKNYELKGFQAKASVDYQITSDVLLGASWTGYFDISKTEVDYQSINVKAKIAF